MHTNWAKLLLVGLQSIASQYDKNCFIQKIFYQDIILQVVVLRVVIQPFLKKKGGKGSSNAPRHTAVKRKQCDGTEDSSSAEKCQVGISVSVSASITLSHLNFFSLFFSKYSAVRRSLGRLLTSPAQGLASLYSRSKGKTSLSS